MLYCFQGLAANRTLRKLNKVFGKPEITIRSVGTEQNPKYEATTIMGGRLWTGTGMFGEARLSEHFSYKS